MIKQLLFSIIFIFSISAYGQSYKIIKLVNDQVITNYDLEKRLQLFSILNSVEITDKNVDHFAKEMIKLMVDEKILMNSDNAKNIESELKLNDINISILEDSIKIQLGWSELSNKLFYRDAEISEIDLKNALSQNPSLSVEQAKYLITQNQVELRSRKLLRDLRAESNIENR